MKTGIKLRVIALMGLTMATVAHADSFVSVCNRSVQFRNALTSQLNKSCDQITVADLATVQRVTVNNTNLHTYNPRDMDDMPNLTILNLNNNKFVTLPAQAFVNLPNLTTLVIIDVPLIHLPSDFIVGNSKIQNLIMYKNDFGYIPSHILSRIEDLPELKVLQLTAALTLDEQNELTTLFPSGGPIDLSFPTN